jgi:uncharacterized membrane protein
LENLKLEINKDIFAELLFLSQKGYIQIQKIERKYIIIKDNDMCNNCNDLLHSQKFILSSINSKADLKDLITFMKKNKKKLEYLYEQDCFDLGYLKRIKDVFRNDRLERIILYLFFGSLGCLGIADMLPKAFFDTTNVLFIILAFTLLALINVAPSSGIAFIVDIIFNRIILIRSSKAKEDYAKWLAFKDFLEEYTLIKNYNLESINLLEDYLTYSIALGVTKINLK